VYRTSKIRASTIQESRECATYVYPPFILPIVPRAKPSCTYLSHTWGHPVYGRLYHNVLFPRIFFPRLYDLFMARGERLSRIRRRPKLARNPQNAGRTPLSRKDEPGIKRRFHLRREAGNKLDKYTCAFPTLTASSRFGDETERRHRNTSFTRNATSLIDQWIQLSSCHAV